MPTKRQRIAYKREEREYQILVAFTVNIQAGKGEEMTVAEIARALKMRPSTKLRNMVNGLVTSGALKVRYAPNPTGGIVETIAYYSLVEGSAFRKSPQAEMRRLITFKSFKKPAQQIELWS